MVVHRSRPVCLLLAWWTLPLLVACEPSTPAPPVRSSTELPSSSGPSSSTEDDAFARRLVEAHNRVRAAVDPPAEPPLPPLAWSEDLARIARRWAEECRFAHSPDLDEQKLGENLAAFSDATGSVEKTVGNWAAEAKDYDLAANQCTPGAQCGHYTQVVWRDTRKVGCAVVECTENSPFPDFSHWQLWVCNYSPPGNWVGERPY